MIYFNGKFISEWIFNGKQSFNAYIFSFINTIVWHHGILEEKHISFSIRTIIGTIIGILLGVVIQLVSRTPENPLDITWINETTKWYSLFGNGFIDLIRMIVIPLIVISIIHVIISIKNSSNIKNLTSKPFSDLL